MKGEQSKYNIQSRRYQIQQQNRSILVTNHIPLRKIGKQIQNKAYQVYVEQAAYMMMIADIEVYNEDKRVVCLQDCYNVLESTKSYNTMEVVYFYMKMRKLGKILHREYFSWDQKQRYPRFIVYSKVEDYRQRKNGEYILVIQSTQKTSEILSPQLLSQNGPLKLYVTSSLDGVCLQIGKPFHITSEK